MDIKEAMWIPHIAQAEMEKPHWSQEARNQLIDIWSTALEVYDHLSGHKGFEDAPARLDQLLTDWAENVHYATFARRIAA